MLTPELRADIIAHARRFATMSPPEEMAGLVAQGRFHPLVNQSADRCHSFRLDADQIGSFAKIEAIVHSHPGGPAFPSLEDMRQQQVSALPWIIAAVPTATRSEIREDVFIWGENPPVLDWKAGYRHGVSDCYALIRGWYAAYRGVTLPEFPRHWEWWLDGHDLYAEGLAKAGFERLPLTEMPKSGDVFLASVRAPVINHAGIWLGDGLIAHHLAGREPVDPSRIPMSEPAERWRKFIQAWARLVD
ncbi:Mov34/MPN/PAD-1 family protein [Alphaproteobacteria bacterium LSUCC0684]